MSKEYDEEISLNGETENCEEIGEPLRTLKLREMEIDTLKEQIFKMERGEDYWRQDEINEVYDLKCRLTDLIMEREDIQAEKVCLIAECRNLENRLKAANNRILMLEKRLDSPKQDDVASALEMLMKNSKEILTELQMINKCKSSTEETAGQC